MQALTKWAPTPLLRGPTSLCGAWLSVWARHQGALLGSGLPGWQPLRQGRAAATRGLAWPRLGQVAPARKPALPSFGYWTLFAAQPREPGAGPRSHCAGTAVGPCSSRAWARPTARPCGPPASRRPHCARRVAAVVAAAAARLPVGGAAAATATEGRASPATGLPQAWFSSERQGAIPLTAPHRCSPRGDAFLGSSHFVRPGPWPCEGLSVASQRFEAQTRFARKARAAPGREQAVVDPCRGKRLRTQPARLQPSPGVGPLAGCH